jgi:DNA repair protein RecN (Recombination protein N)
MIKSLFIQHYALIEELSVEFSHARTPSGQGLVIITGETGAGKSIIVGALSLIIGDRANADVIRVGNDKAIVEGVFDIAGNKKVKILLEENELDQSAELIIRREISAKGQSRCFVNDTPITIGLQKRIGELLVDLHGQHEHQSLLRRETHIEMLDDFGGLVGLVEEYQSAFRRLGDATNVLQEMRSREERLREKREFYQFQIQEIDAVAPRAGEEEQLESELKILENAETLFTATGKLYEMMYEGEQSIHDLLVLVRNQLRDLSEIDKQFDVGAKESESALSIISELAKFTQSYNAKIEFNPERLESLRQKLGRLAQLKRKYGGSLESVIAHREKVGQEVALAENFDEVMEKLVAEVEAARGECTTLAQRLTAKRLETARKIDKGIVAELNKLGIRNAVFTTAIKQVEMENGAISVPFITLGKRRVVLNLRGCDDVEFLISTNLGEEVKPLVKVASGGEVSRIMLALKSILAKTDRLPVLIFDEIDVGVSGRVAQAVGLSLKSLSSFHQVIAITHLPQIAGLADTHFVVSKSEDGNRTTTSMRKLSLDERVQEVAKLMSGAEVTEAGMVGARELMGMK